MDKQIEKGLNAIFEKNDIDLIQAILNPRTILDGNEYLNKANGTMTYPVLICDNPDSELQPIPNQLNFILPLAIIKSTDPYVINLKKDLNMYRFTYEQYSKEVNTIIGKTKESMKSLYSPLKKLKNDIKNNSKIYLNSIRQLLIPLKNERDNLNNINYTAYSEEKQKEFLNDKEEITKQINNFNIEAEKYCENYEKINKNTLEEIENFFQKFISLATPAKELSTFMNDFFKTFEKSSSKFDDLNNKEKISKVLQNIKTPINNFQSKIETINELLKPLEEMKNTNKIDNINKIVEDNKKIRENLIHKSEIISNAISKIREKYGVPEKPNIKIDIKPPQNIDVSNVNKNLEEAQNKINKDVKEKIEIINENNLKIKKQTRLDLLFIMDITNSMDVYLNQAKSSILNMIEEIRKNCAGIDIYLGFIGYKDFTDLDFGDEYVNLEFTTDYEAIKNKIAPLKAQGGGDIPEDLCGAFDFAKTKEWEGKSRFAILVTDSPCHGTKYHNFTGEGEDNFPDGDKINRNIEEYIEFFAKNEISLFCLKINSTTDKMFGIFKEIYEKNKTINSNNQFVVGEGKTLFSVVVENAVKTFQNRKELEIKESL